LGENIVQRYKVFKYYSLCIQRLVKSALAGDGQGFQFLLLLSSRACLNGESAGYDGIAGSELPSLRKL
jgi:hypothetical protein